MHFFLITTSSQHENRACRPPASRAFLLLITWFWCTRERLCTNWVRFLWSMRCTLLGYSFGPGRSNRLVPCTAGSVICDLDRFINKWMLALEKTSCQERSSSCGDFQGLKQFRHSLLFLIPSLKKTKGGVQSARNFVRSNWNWICGA